MSHKLALAGENAFVAAAPCGPAADAATLAHQSPLRPMLECPQRPMQITVECIPGERLDIARSDWLDLLKGADEPNVFMNPTLVQLAANLYPTVNFRTLLAWEEVGLRHRLVGIWTFAVRRMPQSVLPMRVLVAPASEHAYLATPVIDRGLLDETLNAMLDYIAAEPGLPKILALDSLASDGAIMQALGRVLAERGSQCCDLGRSVRPKLASDLDVKAYFGKALSGSTRKKLRQHRRRLGEKGTLEFRIATQPEAVRHAFEQFLLLESSGWKGRQGTSLLSNKADGTFARKMIALLAANGDASVHALYLDGLPVSMQVVLRAGSAAFTWKTAYDETLHEVSPGMLLLEEYTAAFLADHSIEYVDSCAYDANGFMAAWMERQAIARMWIDVRRGRSLGFMLLSSLQREYLKIRGAAKAVYQAQARRRVR